MATTHADSTKSTLHRYLNLQRDAACWKLEGLSEAQARRPLTPTGTNLIGIIKHLACVELGYFGDCFDRPGEQHPWLDEDAEDNADMFATGDESVTSILAFYQRARAHSDATIAALDLDARATVPWWSQEKRHPTLATLLIHMTTETARHVGQMDIVRELIDGRAGLYAGNQNLPAPTEDARWWADYRDKVNTARPS